MLGWTLITPPFSAPKFATSLAGLAVVTGLSLSPFGNRPVPGAYKWRDDPAAQASTFDLIRFAKPSDDIEDRWEEIGIPWLLRNEGVIGVVAAEQPHRLTIALTWQGKALGRIVEKTTMITPNGTRLYLAFVPDDMALVKQLAAPIDTTLDPLALMQATLDEHVRSHLDGDAFDLSILKPGSLQTMLLHFLHASEALRHPATDDFPASTIDVGAAAIDKAYRDEAKYSGGDAAK